MVTETGNSSGLTPVEEGVTSVPREPNPGVELRPVVMKFGGSSVADLDRVRTVAGLVVERARSQPVVVVVSAMGKTTDSLVEQARALCASPAQREMDMLLTTGERISMALLSLAIHGRGREAISLTGSQCGIITDHQHGRARIMEVRPFRILDELAAGHVVIVGGFQGVSYKREVTTLGRGGSDTTAVALAAALHADCEIYSDVDGVYSADPRVVEAAQRIDTLSHAEMRALSRAGARVLHARAVEMAEERGIAIYTRATPSGHDASTRETVIRRNPPSTWGVRAVASDPAIVDVRIHWDVSSHNPERVARLAAGLGGLGLRYLAIDDRGASGMLSTTQRDDADAVLATIGDFAGETSGGSIEVEARHGLALVSCIGSGLEDRPHLTDVVWTLLGDANVTIEAVRSDANSLAFVVASADAGTAVRVLHAGLIESATRVPRR